METIQEEYRFDDVAIQFFKDEESGKEVSKFEEFFAIGWRHYVDPDKRDIGRRIFQSGRSAIVMVSTVWWCRDDNEAVVTKTTPKPYRSVTWQEPKEDAYPGYFFQDGQHKDGWVDDGAGILWSESVPGAVDKRLVIGELFEKAFKQLSDLVYASGGKFFRVELNKTSTNRGFMNAHGAWLRRPCCEGIKCKRSVCLYEH